MREQHDRRAAWEAVALGMLVTIPLLPYLLFLGRTGIPRFTLEGDYAGLELAARFVGSGQTLLGPYSRFHFNHPGPLYFYFLALAVALGGKSSTGLFAGACILNAVAAAGTVVAVRLFCTRAHAMAVTLVLLAWLAAFGNACVQPWNPMVVVLPLISFLVLAALFAVGTAAVAPWLALGGAFVIETHLSTVPTVAGVAIAALAARGIVLRRRSPAGGAKRHMVIAGLVLGLAALPPLLEQVESRQGNLTKIEQFFLERRAAKTPFAIAFAQWANATSWLPERLLHRTLLVEADPYVMYSEPISSSPSRFAVGVSVGWAFAVLGAGAVAWRRRDRVSMALLATGLLASSLGVLALRAIVGPAFCYLVFWATAGTTVGWIGVGATLATMLASLTARVRPARQTAVLVASLLMAASAGAVTTSFQHAWVRRNRLYHPPIPGLRDVYAALLARVREGGEAPVVHTESAWYIGISFALELVKDGVTPHVAARDKWLLGRQFPDAESASHPLHVYSGIADRALPTSPCLELLAKSGAVQVGIASLDILQCGKSPQEDR